MFLFIPQECGARTERPGCLWSHGEGYLGPWRPQTQGILRKRVSSQVRSHLSRTPLTSGWILAPLRTKYWCQKLFITATTIMATPSLLRGFELTAHALWNEIQSCPTLTLEPALGFIVIGLTRFILLSLLYSFFPSSQRKLPKTIAKMFMYPHSHGFR